jgi:hypothetical protein
VRSRPFWLQALTLLACQLTLAASGDDMCLPRLVFRAAFASAGQLPQQRGGTMDFPSVLVAAATVDDRTGAVLLVDFNKDNFEVVLPYQVGGLAVEQDRVWVAHVDPWRTRTRLDVYRRHGRTWTRPVPHCTDTHSLVRTGDRLALASTGTNEVVFLDLHGAVVGRWSPDARAESDSWHLNSLVAWGKRLAITCFGRFTTYREYAGRPEGTGLLVEVPSGAVLASGLTFPHDPCRVADGWFVNDALLHRTLFFADGEPAPRTVCNWPLFARGLAVTPRWLVVGLSRWRHDGSGTGYGAVAVVDRQAGTVLRTLALPHAEIANVVPAPCPELLDTMRAAGARLAELEAPGQDAFPPEGRRGAVTVLGPLAASPSHPGYVEVTVRLVNEGGEVWSSHDGRPVWLGYEVLDAANRAVEPARTPLDLPMPVLPGRTLTFRALFDLSGGDARRPPDSVRLTLMSASGEWWAADASWRPCQLPVAVDAALPMYCVQAERERQAA